jgi:hypothetical protein
MLINLEVFQNVRQERKRHAILSVDLDYNGNGNEDINTLIRQALFLHGITPKKDMRWHITTTVFPKLGLARTPLAITVMDE